MPIDPHAAHLIERSACSPQEAEPGLRAAARRIFAAGLRGVSIDQAVRQTVLATDTALQVGDTVLPWSGLRQVLVLAAGKAAATAARALTDVLLPALAPRPGLRLRGLVISGDQERPAGLDQRLDWRSGPHPVPDVHSAANALAAQHLLRGADAGTLVFFLLSGGSSAMLDAPLLKTISMDDLAAFHQALVHSGLPIQAMNTLRKHVSVVKGGRLATLAQIAAWQSTLVVSDVPPGQEEVVGSGPSLPDPTTLDDCRLLLTTALAQVPLPAAVQDAFRSGALPETPKPGHPGFTRSSVHRLLSSDDLAAAARRGAEPMGFHTVVDNSCDEWPYEEAARYLLDRLHQLQRHHGRVCLISAGEVGVRLHGEHGMGGRNQQFVLFCARELAARSFHATVLSAGSDGVDGNSPAAGGVADHTTAQRALEAGFTLEAALSGFNAFPLLRALGDAVVPGPTGHNLRDLRVLLCEEARPAKIASL